MKPVLLSEVVDFNPRFGKDELDGDSLASFIPMRSVEEESGRYEPLGDRKVSEVSKGYTPFRDGDVIFAKVTPCMENGKAAVLKGLTNGIGFGSTEFFVLRPKDSLDAHYLFHFILQQNFRREAARNMTGAVGLRRVPKSWLEQQMIPLPPRPKQRRIVAEIEKQFTRLDAGVAALRRVHANLKRYRAAVLKAACEGRLVPSEAELARNESRTFETGEQLLQRILAERCKNWKGRGKYKDPVAPKEESMDQLPSGWAWATWDQIGFSQNGRPFPSSAYQDSGVKLLRPGNLHVGGKVVWTDDNTRYLPMKFLDENPDLLVAGNELVMNLTAQSLKDEFLGRVCLTAGDDHCLLNQRLARLTPIVISAQFALILLKTWRFRRFVDGLNSGSLIQHMFTSQLAEFTFPLPPLLEQKRIVAEVERRLSVIDELETVVTANLARATRLRQSVLQQAFTSGSKL